MNIKLGALLIFLQLLPASAWRPFTVELENISIEVFQPQIFNMNFTFTNQIINGHANLLKDISRPFIHFELLHDSGQPGHRVFDLVYMNRTIDGCVFLNNRKLNVFFEIMYRTISDYTELPKHCPIRKKHYKVVNFTMDPEKFPPFLPDHSALAKGVIWNQENGKKNILLKGSLIVTVENTFKNNKKMVESFIKT